MILAANSRQRNRYALPIQAVVARAVIRSRHPRRASDHSPSIPWLSRLARIAIVVP